MIRQLLKQERLFFARERVGRPCILDRKQLDLRCRFQPSLVRQTCKKVGLGFALFSAELKQSGCEHQRPTHPASVAMKVPLEAATVLDSFATDSYCEHGTVS